MADGTLVESFTKEQILSVFERIASMSDTGLRTLIEHEDNNGAALIIEYIGALADSMCGEGVIGDTCDWACGPVFRRQKWALSAAAA